MLTPDQEEFLVALAAREGEASSNTFRHPPGRPWVILGIHGADVHTVVGNVARVRLFIKDSGEFLDEDFQLPDLKLLPGVPDMAEVYQALLTPAITARLAQLK